MKTSKAASYASVAHSPMCQNGKQSKGSKAAYLLLFTQKTPKSLGKTSVQTKDFCELFAFAV
jgi:hypothetical protein